MIKIKRNNIFQLKGFTMIELFGGNEYFYYFYINSHRRIY